MQSISTTLGNFGDAKIKKRPTSAPVTRQPKSFPYGNNSFFYYYFIFVGLFSISLSSIQSKNFTIHRELKYLGNEQLRLTNEINVAHAKKIGLNPGKKTGHYSRTQSRALESRATESRAESRADGRVESNMAALPQQLERPGAVTR